VRRSVLNVIIVGLDIAKYISALFAVHVTGLSVPNHLINLGKFTFVLVASVADLLQQGSMMRRTVNRQLGVSSF